MMKNRYTTSAVLLFTLFLGGCAEQEMDSPVHGDSFTIEVSDGGFLSADAGVTTRAVENGFKTVFTSGDRLGLIVTDGSNQLEIDNKAFTFDGTKWTDAGGSQNITYDASYRYLVYYPYSETMNGKKTEDEIKNAFTPKADQRSYADYTASDLMIGTGGVFNTAGNILRMELKHVRTMLILVAPQYTYKWKEQTYNWIPDNFSDGGLVIGNNVYVPWQSGTNETRLLLSASELSSGFIRYFYTQDGQKKTGTAKISSGQQGKYQWIVPETSVYTLAPGAVYYADGTRLPSAAGYTGSTPIGIVFKTGAGEGDNISNYTASTFADNVIHGYVVALKNIDGGRKSWGNISNVSLHTDNTNFYGYSNTQVIKNAAGYDEANFWACYHAVNYAPAAPASGTSGWYLPSLGEYNALWQVYGEIQSKLTAAGGTDMKISWGFYWTTSKKNSSAACVDFGAWSATGSFTNAINTDNAYVRPVLTF